MNAPSGMVIGSPAGWRPQESERWRGPGLWLALAAHGVLLLGLALSMNWKLSDPAPVEAEVWSDIPQIAGGAAPPPPAQREVPREVPANRPEPEPEPQPQRQPDLTIAKTPPKTPPKSQPKKPEPVKKAEPPKVVPAKPEKVVKPAAVTAPQSRSLSAAELEAQRKANMARLMASLGGEAAGPGTAARSSGPSAGYAGRIIARVKPNIVFAETINGNPQAVVEVRCAPDGRIMSRRLLSSSGVSAWDDAVLRALDRTEVLPSDVDGRVPPLMQLSFKPRDF